MKKKNWLLTIAFAVLALTIVSTTVLGGTYAKFVSRVSGGAEAQAAGFKVTADGAITAAGELIAPGESITSSKDITYFSQVDTLITVDNENYGVTLTGALTNANWESIVSTYNAAHANDGYAVDANLAPEDVFKVVGAAGSLETTILEALEDQGLTVHTFTIGEGQSAVTYYVVKAMGPNASAAVTATIEMGVEWADDYVAAAGTWYKIGNNYVTAAAYADSQETEGEGKTTGTVAIADIIDEFDTYLGGLIYEGRAHMNTSGAEPVADPITTNVTVSIPVTATQNTVLNITWEDSEGQPLTTPTATLIS